MSINQPVWKRNWNNILVVVIMYNTAATALMPGNQKELDTPPISSDSSTYYCVDILQRIIFNLFCEDFLIFIFKKIIMIDYFSLKELKSLRELMLDFLKGKGNLDCAFSFKG